MEQRKTWVITDASQGLGLVIVKYLLSRHQQVVAITRNRRDFFHKTGLSHPRLDVVGLDLTSEAGVEKAISKIHRSHGRIDVLINNAGYGYLGAVEEASQEEISNVFEANVFSTLRMIRHVLPYMRDARSGHIFNLSTIGGITDFPGFGVYNATKSAVEGFSKALSAELAELGIKVTIIEPGYFHTHFLDNSLFVAKKDIEDYQYTAGGNGGMEDNGKQGDAELAARTIYEVANEKQPPLRLLLGEGIYRWVKAKPNITLEEFERMKPITVTTAFHLN
jgi:NAD(P)-dependent dehydrogenase (short-subunit alcohol dehydrogenase family)